MRHSALVRRVADMVLAILGGLGVAFFLADPVMNYFGKTRFWYVFPILLTIATYMLAWYFASIGGLKT